LQLFTKPGCQARGIGSFALGMSNASQRGNFLPHHSTAIWLPYFLAYVRCICTYSPCSLALPRAHALPSLSLALSLSPLSLSPLLLSCSFALTYSLSHARSRALSFLLFSQSLPAPLPPSLSLFLLVVIVVPSRRYISPALAR